MTPRKKVILVAAAIAVLAAAAVFACKDPLYMFGVHEENDYSISSDSRVTAVLDTFTAANGVYRIVNGSSQTVYCVTHVQVQVYKQGRWYNFEDDRASEPCAVLTIEAGGEESCSAFWRSGGGALSSGHYRFVTPIKSAGATWWIAAEFTIA